MKYCLHLTGYAHTQKYIEYFRTCIFPLSVFPPQTMLLIPGWIVRLLWTRWHFIWFYSMFEWIFYIFRVKPKHRRFIEILFLAPKKERVEWAVAAEWSTKCDCYPWGMDCCKRRPPNAACILCICTALNIFEEIFLRKLTIVIHSPIYLQLKKFLWICSIHSDEVLSVKITSSIIGRYYRIISP